MRCAAPRRVDGDGGGGGGSSGSVESGKADRVGFLPGVIFIDWHVVD